MKETKIVCVDSSGSSFLEKGKVYEVADINKFGNKQVINVETLKTSAHWYRPERFEPYKEPKTIDLSKNYRTKAGRTVQLAYHSKDQTYPVVGELLANGVWTNEFWTNEGKYFNGAESPNDLVEIPNHLVLEICSIYPKAGASFEVDKHGSAYVYLDKYVASLSKKNMDDIYAYLKNLKGE